MRASDFILAFGPLVILAALRPAFEASTLPNLVKGGVIGLYLAISIIALLQMRRRLRS